MSATTNAAPSLIGASAGSGKTYHLTEVVTAAVDSRQPDAIALEGLLAVTFTNKGAAELASRIRQSFARSGAHQSTHELPLAYIGTVHAVCLRLVKEFAIDAGLSPLVDVAAGSEDRLLRQALEWGLEPAFRQRLDELAWAFELRLDSKTARVDWFTPVQDIMTLARSNRIAPDALRAMATRSADRLLQLLGPAEPDGALLDAALMAALQSAAQALAKIDDGQKNTQDVKNTVADYLKKVAAGNLKWSDWLKLEGLKPGKSALLAVAELRQAASAAQRHPRLQAELRELTEHVYQAAAHGLRTYDAWKQRRRIIDFVDMLDRALTLVEHPDVLADLSQRFSLLVVDEFQDTSPVQLALFVRLHQLAGRSTWVGDRKQCIFEYAGADPELMQAVTDWARAAGGGVQQLQFNYRSRPELVQLSNALFSQALARHGYSEQEVCTSPKRACPPALAALPPLGVWALAGNTNAEEASALAEGVRRLLTDPDATQIHDRATGELRSLRAGDVAILVATNKEAEALAEALAPRGVRAAIARAGLLDTPEGVLTKAALRSLLEPGNALAAAELEALTGFGGADPEAWLDERVTIETARRAAKEAGVAWPKALPRGPAAKLEPLRAELQALSPSEALDRVLGCLDVASLCRRWPDPNQRLANLDALRGLAASYEQRCAQNREAASVAGLLRYFDEASQKVLVHGEELASDDQHTSIGPDAVTLVTYHRSKGLEWPVVILASLGRPARRHAFDVTPETDRGAFDPGDPLGGRWIRYWPWPFGATTSGRLRESTAASPEGLAIAAREERERVRLLYVGFTRARDHLVLAARTRQGGYDTKWLDCLRDATGNPLLTLPPASQLDSATCHTLVGLGSAQQRLDTRAWSISADTALPPPAADPARNWFLGGEPPAIPRLSYWIAPSRAASEWRDLEHAIADETVTTGQRLPLGSDTHPEWNLVGDAVHAFLACDVPELSHEQRLERATRLLAAADLLGLLFPDALLQAGDNLRAWIDSRWPGATHHRELPISAMIATSAGRRRVQGTIDLLLELPSGVVIIDHKTYPGRPETWRGKAQLFAPQFAAYAQALRLAGKPVLEQWVSFAVAGGAVRLSPPPS